MDPVKGEQRCHGGCDVGRQPALTESQAWEIAGRPLTHTESCHHQPPSRRSNLSLPNMSAAQLQQIAPFLHDSVRAVQITADGLVDVDLDVSPEQRSLFRANATAWELTRSGILFALGALPPRYVGTPIIDDSGTVIGYFSALGSDTGFHRLDLLDLDGNLISSQTQEDPIQSDVLGNEIVATIFTLGASAVVRSVARVVLAKMATAGFGKAVAEIVVASARGISVEAERATLLYLRALRARSIVTSMARRGVPVIVNIGGEGAPGEIAEFGEQIALNHAVRMPIQKRVVSNLIKEPGENIGVVFRNETIDKVVARKVDVQYGFDGDKIAQGAYKVLKSGGKLNMSLYTNNPAFGAAFTKSLQDAGFKNVTNIGNAVFMAVK